VEGGGCVCLVCKMQRSESSCAKRARLLSLNQICEIVMDSDSDEAQCNTSGTEDEEMEPCPPSQKSPLSQAGSSFAVHSTDKQWHVLDFTAYYGFCISQTITGRLTVMTDYEK